LSICGYWGNILNNIPYFPIGLPERKEILFDCGTSSDQIWTKIDMVYAPIFLLKQRRLAVRQRKGK
jgi:hypothetical protein